MTQKMETPSNWYPLFDDAALTNKRMDGESYEDYKKRQKSNAEFYKMYKRYGREGFIKFMNFLEQMGGK